MKIFLSFALLATFTLSAQNSSQIFLNTPTYQQVISSYDSLDKRSEFATLTTMGMTDAGIPLHVFIISGKKCFNKQQADKLGLPVILINNGIHPGEPDGIDASLQLVKDLLTEPGKYSDILQKVVICIIPVYNIDGALNRGSFSRANQNGPLEYGFRGNAKNLDLNRDFMKMDSENARSFAEIFQQWKPHLLIDTHVSDGADYQYTMTYILSQKDKMNSALAAYQDHELLPAIQKEMISKNFEMIPYVETLGETPESGISAFLESARFSTGYSALFDCMGIISETHMLKPYNDRVWATYWFLLESVRKIAMDSRKIFELKDRAVKESSILKIHKTRWQLDTTKFSEIEFKGYEASHKPSEISGLPRLYYDRSKPYVKKIKHYTDYKPTLEIKLPDYYILPQGWKRVIENLKLNGANMETLKKDTIMEVESVYIEKYETVKTPYEAHYLHSDIKTRYEKQKINFRKGDLMIKLNSPANRFIAEALEPQSTDSYFNWNFFDGILQQKEWFSDYVFEDIAAEYLKEHPELRSELENLRKSDKTFAESSFAQLLWVYRHSPYYEKSHNRLPVYRGYNAR